MYSLTNKLQQDTSQLLPVKNNSNSENKYSQFCRPEAMRAKSLVANLTVIQKQSQSSPSKFEVREHGQRLKSFVVNYMWEPTHKTEEQLKPTYSILD